MIHRLGKVTGKGSNGCVFEDRTDPTLVIKVMPLYQGQLKHAYIESIAVAEAARAKGARSSSSSSSSSTLQQQQQQQQRFEKTQQHTLETHMLDGSTIREICVLRQFPHPNVISIQGDILDASQFSSYDNRVAIVIPHAGISVLKLAEECMTKKINTDAFNRIIASVLTDTAQGMAHLHAHHILHGDMKPDNLIYTKSTNKTTIVDLGSCVINRAARQAHEGLCTYIYESYETLDPSCIPYYGPINDVWSLGMVIFALLLGGHPNWPTLPLSATTNVDLHDAQYRHALFLHMSNVRNESGKSFLCFEHLFCKQSQYAAGMERYKGLHAHFKQLLQRMMSFTPSERPTMAQIAEFGIRHLHDVYQMNKPLHAPTSPIYHPIPISLDYLDRLQISFFHRNSTIHRLWLYVIGTDRKYHLCDSSSGMYAFILAVHIFERYCSLRTKLFSHLHEYVACAFIAYHFACSLLFVRYHRVDMSRLYHPTSEETAERALMLKTLTSSKDSKSIPFPIYHPNATHPVRTKYHLFLLKLRSLSMDMLLTCNGVLYEQSFHDITTMSDSITLYGLVTRIDYYKFSHTELTARYHQIVSLSKMCEWYDDDGDDNEQEGSSSNNNNNNNNSKATPALPMHSPPGPAQMNATLTTTTSTTTSIPPCTLEPVELKSATSFQTDSDMKSAMTDL